MDNDNIIYMNDYEFADKKEQKYLYLVMDLQEDNLQAILRRHRKQRDLVNSIVRKLIAFQIFKGLYYMQNNNVCPRDMKPFNLLIDPQTYQTRICDFGSAKIIDKEENNVSYFVLDIMELLSYCFIDIWSAGCILVELLTRQPVFPGDSSLQQLIQIIKVIGTPPQQYFTKYFKGKKLDLNVNIPVEDWQKVLGRYNPVPQLIGLISKILVYDIQLRYTPLKILTHEYFYDLTSDLYSEYTEKLPNLFQFKRLRNLTNKNQIKLLQQLYNTSKKKTNSTPEFDQQQKRQDSNNSDFSSSLRQVTNTIIITQINHNFNKNTKNIIQK